MTNKEEKVETSGHLLTDYQHGIELFEKNKIKSAVLLWHYIEQQINILALFSENEELDEISTESLPYLLVSYYLMSCYSNHPNMKTQDRISHLQKAYQYAQEVLQLLTHYNFITNTFCLFQLLFS